MPRGLGPALERPRGRRAGATTSGHRGCWGWWPARLALPPRSPGRLAGKAYPALLGSGVPHPSLFSEAPHGLPPWGAARQSEGLRGTPHPLIRALRPRNRWNSGNSGNLSRPWGEGCDPSPISTPPQWATPWLLSPLELGGFSLSHFPRPCWVWARSLRLGLGAEAPKASHTPCSSTGLSQQPRPPDGKGPGAKAGGHGSGQRAWMEESVACPPRWPPGGGAGRDGVAASAFGGSGRPTLVQSPRPRATSLSISYVGFAPVHPRCRGPELPGHVYFIKHKLRSRVSQLSLCRAHRGPQRHHREEQISPV